MQGFEKVSGIVGVLAALLAIGAAFETFTNFGLVAKLSVAGAAAIFLSLALAGTLAGWSKPTTDLPGYGREPARPLISRMVVSAAVLLLVAGLAICLSYFIIAQFATRLDETMTSEKSSAALTASLSKLDRLTIQLPDRKHSACRWSDQSTGAERLDLQVIDWDSPIPKLQVDSFHSPQRMTIECWPAYRLRRIFIEPASAVLYRTEEIASLRTQVFFIGGLIWLAACGLCALLLRQ